MNEQGKNALIRVAEWLEAGAKHTTVGDHNIARFDMEQSIASEGCGTACCIAGAVVQFEGLVKPVIHGALDFFDGHFEDGVGTIAARHLGMSEDNAERMFEPWQQFEFNSYEEFSDPQRAAKVVRHYLETGVVAWDLFEPAPEFVAEDEE